MDFIVKVFTIKGNLVFMNNFYHKLAVASICTALGFAIGASEEAKAATFNLYFPLTFQVYDGGSFGSFDGLGDAVDSVAYVDPDTAIFPNWYMVERTTAREVAGLIEFPIPGLTQFSITRAILRVQVEWLYTFYEGPRTLSLFGYVGNGTAEASDLEAGIFLESVTDSRATGGSFAEFNVTPFLNTLVSNNNEFAGFALRSLAETNGSFILAYEGLGNQQPPTLIVDGEYEVVPEPTTIFGSAIGLCLGGWLKRKKSTSQNKAKSQA
jgi:hypothetical protein